MRKSLNIIESKKGNNDINHFDEKKSSFILTLSYTETASIPGLTSAGANTELIKYTPPADAEYIQYGKCKCLDTIPATPDGKPTPAIITKTALEISNIPMIVVDSGSIIKPLLPHININSKYGKNIVFERALELKDVIENFHMGEMIGKQVSNYNDVLIIGESIPGGTTTALGVLLTLGINAINKISSSMPINPHNLKNNIVEKAMARSNIKYGELKDDPFKAISHFGDPMMATVAGLVKEALHKNKKIILAGGTQMCCIVAILRSLNTKFNNNLCIGTTSYVIKDNNSDIQGITEQITDELPIFYADLQLENSLKKGLKSYSEGFVKEGAGAGGATIATYLNTKNLTSEIFLKKIEQNYYETIEKLLS